MKRERRNDEEEEEKRRKSALLFGSEDTFDSIASQEEKVYVLCCYTLDKLAKYIDAISQHHLRVQ